MRISTLKGLLLILLNGQGD